MTIAFISDIHANKPALDAVLDHINTQPVDYIACLGDVIGYGPHPRECLERIQETADLCLKGNHDRAVTTPELYSQNEMAAAGLRHAATELTTTQIEWLQNLENSTVAINGQVLAAHSHPDPDHLDEYVYPGDATNLHPYYREHNVDVIALGHTHQPFSLNSRKFHDWCGLTLNPGSVGQPRDGDPRAGYAIVDPDTLDCTHHRVEYDVERTTEAIHDADLPDATADRLIHGEVKRTRSRY